MDGPFVSILMPSYNAEQYLVKAVQSILNQTYKNFELLLLDDCSTDQTFQIITSFSDERIKVYRNPENIGYLKSCNFLFGEAKGELITFQDSDDWSYPTRIERQVEQFRVDQDLVLCATGSKTQVTIDGLTIDSVSGVSTDQDIRKFISDTGTLPFTCATMMVKRKVIETIGPYREFFDRIGAEHVDWAYMICEKFRSALVDDILYFYSFNPTSFTKIPSVDIRKRKSLALAKFLHLQRIKSGRDDLQTGSTKLLDQFIAELEKPYLSDRSLLFREGALDSLNKRIYLQALKQTYQAITRGPASGSNWAALVTVLSRSFIGVVRIVFRKIAQQGASE